MSNDLIINPGQAAAQALLDMREAAGGWTATNFNDVPVIDSAHVLVASDAHVPAHSEKLIAQMLEQAYREEVDTILWAGDLMNMEAFSTYGVDDPSNSFQRDLRICGALLHGAAKMGFNQHWSSGNHELRIHRATKQHLGMEQLAYMAGLQDLIESGMLTVSDNPSVYLSVGNWLVTHPAQYGSTPGIVPSKLATRYDCNVISAHAHHWAMTTDETGRYIAIESGGLFDPDLHRYIQYSVTTHRAWQNGWVIGHDGQMQLYRGFSTRNKASEARQERLVESGV